METPPSSSLSQPGLRQALFSNLGYTYLDVRPEIELEEIGKVKGSVNIPIVLATRRYDPDQGRKVSIKEDNPDFIAEVRAPQAPKVHWLRAENASQLPESTSAPAPAFLAPQLALLALPVPCSWRLQPLPQVERRFPDRDTPLLVACSNGRTYSMDALMALEEAGYTNIVGLRGGFYSWNKCAPPFPRLLFAPVATEA